MGLRRALDPDRMKVQEGPRWERQERSTGTQGPEEAVGSSPSSLPRTLRGKSADSSYRENKRNKHVPAVCVTHGVVDSSRCPDSSSSGRSSSRSEDSTGTSRSPGTAGLRHFPGLRFPQTPTLVDKKKNQTNIYG